MPPRSEPVPRARAAVHWLSGLALLGILAGGVIAAAVALWENVDVRSLARQAAGVTESPPLPGEQTGPMAVSPAGTVSALLVSRASAGFFPDSSFYPATIRRWETMLEELGSVRRIASAAEMAELPPGALLVAPDAICLAQMEVDALSSHVEAGGSLVIDRATGARDEKCEWRGWNVVQSLTGSIDVLERPAEQSLFFTLPAGLPLSAGLAPGTRVELHPDARLGLLTTGPRAYWSDWALNPVSPEGKPSPDAAAVLRKADGEGRGRVAWFGFRTGQGAGDRNEALLSQVLRNGTRWAAGVLMAEVSPWPAGRQAALLIGQDVESGFANAAYLAALLREKAARASFFVVSELAQENPDVADSLLGAGEIGSQTADHYPTAGLPLGEQTLRLRRSWSQLRRWSGRPPVGLRPPEERFDENTLRAWREVGGEYIAAVNDARSAAPEVYTTPAGPVVLLPRLVDDDYNVLVQEGARRTRRLRDAYLQGMRKLGPLGGIAYLALHTQIGGTPDRVGVVGEVIDSARSQPGNWWLATGEEIARWWLARDGVVLNLPESDPDSLQVRVLSGDGLAGGWIEVYGDALASLVPFDSERQLPYARTEWGLRFAMPELPGGETRTFILRPEPEVSGETHEPDRDASAEDTALVPSPS
jgi:peptidoglycan/xylan/chitin deacetylase (PgdA/CDA1 family)